MPVVKTCAWHEADAVVLAGRLEVKSPAVAGRKGNANKARAGSRNGPSGACLLQAGKHEAEPVYVANSEPTIWQRGGGRAGVGERDLISGEPNPGVTAGREVKLDGIWGGVASYPRKPSWPGVESCERRQKTNPDKEIPKRVGSKGCPQGSPVSPILSNIVLNELDQELERRGHRYCRWADDFLI